MRFINFSNHPSAGWSDRQLAAAREWGEIEDLPFPNVDAGSTETEVRRMADDYVLRILARAPAAVMCQGEFTLTYRVVQRLKEAGIPVLSACSRREVTENNQPDGTVRKIAKFDFVRFREY